MEVIVKDDRSFVEDTRSGGSRIFPGGAPTPKIAIIFHIFAENCMKMKEFGPPGGARVPGAPPLDLPMTRFYLTWGILEIVLTKLRVYSHVLLKSPFFLPFEMYCLSKNICLFVCLSSCTSICVCLSDVYVVKVT